MNTSKYLFICLLCCYGSCVFATAAESVVAHDNQQLTVKSSYFQQLFDTQNDRSKLARKTVKSRQNSEQKPQQKEPVMPEKESKSSEKSIFSRMLGLLLPDGLRTTVHQ